MIWHVDRHVSLVDFVLPPPLPALISILMVAGLAGLGRLLAGRLLRRDPSALEWAGGFILAAGLTGALVHGLALAGLAKLAILRPLSWALAAGGLVALVRWKRPSLPARSGVLDNVALFLGIAIVVALAGAALGPASDADSLDYHLGVPIDWLQHGGAVARPGWFHAAFAGLGESLNLLGLAGGTDGLGAALQWSGMIIAIVALASFASTDRGRILAILLVAACPVVLALVPAQKPQLLPAAATAVAVALLLAPDASSARLLMAAGAVGFAAGSRSSFLLSAAVVSILYMVKSPKRLGAAATLGIALGVLALPVYLRNVAFYGDPIPPFLMDAGPAASQFAREVRISANATYVKAIAGLALPVSAGNLTCWLGLGLVAAVAGIRDRGTPRVLAGLALGLGALQLALAPLSARFFLEPYLWGASAAVIGADRASRSRLLAGMSLQAAGVAAAAGLGAAMLFPGTLAPGLRDAVMTRHADGYAEAKWMEAALPRDAVVLTTLRSAALLPRPWAAWHRAGRGVSEEGLDAAIAGLLAEAGVTHVVRLTGEDLDVPLFNRVGRFGKRVGEPREFPTARRNPFLEAEPVEMEILEVKR